MPTEHPHPNPATLAQALAEQVARDLRAAVQARGHATLAVSGGRSPIALFETLRDLDLPWAQVTVVLVDERCVPTHHPDSNTALVRQHLLQGRAAAARWVAWFDTPPNHLDAQTATGWVAGLNQAFNPAQGVWCPPVDVAILGMGEDGHTASLFPDSPGTDTARNAPGPLAWVQPRHAPHWRLTLTLPTLLACDHLHLSIAGLAKQAVYRQALAGPDDRWPVSWLLNRQGRPLQVWLTD